MSSPKSDSTALSPGIAEIVQQLEEEIALGILRPRERLIEEDLLTRFNVKRHVVRQALADLELMGIVVRPPNRGATVRDFTVHEIEQIYFVREVLERAAIEVMPLPVLPAVLAALNDLNARHGAAATAGRLRDVFRLNLEFHRVFFAACGNVPLADAIAQFAFKAHAIRSYTIGDPVLLARVRKEHAQMIRLLRGNDRRALFKLISDHKQPAKTAYIKASRRLEAGIASTVAETAVTVEVSRTHANRGSGSGLRPSRARKSRSQPSSA